MPRTRRTIRRRSSSYPTSDADLVVNDRLNQIRTLALICPSGIPAVLSLNYPKQLAEFANGQPRQFLASLESLHLFDQLPEIDSAGFVLMRGLSTIPLYQTQRGNR